MEEANSKMNQFIIDLEKDRTDSTILMPRLREDQTNDILKVLEELQHRLENLQNNLITNEPPKDERTKTIIQKDIRSLIFKIKINNETLITNKKLNKKLDDEWDRINQRISMEKDRTMEEVTTYYNKKEENELTSQEFIQQLLTTTPISIIDNMKSMDEMQGDDKNMFKYINETEINKDNYYDSFFTNLKGVTLSQYEDESLAFQLGNPETGGMTPRTPEMNNSIQRVFKKILPVRENFYVYRCYYSSVSVEDINNQNMLGRHTSTSLSYDYSHEWACRNRGKHATFLNTDTGSIMICIIIPKGSHVIPLTYYAQAEEYEILLSSEGKLHFTGDIHPILKIPIFIYFDSYDKYKEYTDNKMGGKVKKRNAKTNKMKTKTRKMKTRKTQK